MGELFGLELTDAQLLVALALADCGNDDGTSIYPSLATVAWKVSKSERQVRRILRQLEALGVLVQLSGSQRHRPAVYAIRIVNGPRKQREGGHSSDRSSSEGGHSSDRSQEINPRGKGLERLRPVRGATRADTAVTSQGGHSCVTETGHPDVRQPVIEPSDVKNGLEAPGRQEARPPAALAREIHEVLLHWRSQCRGGSRDIQLTESREKAIRGRLLRDGITVDDLKAAIDGAAAAIDAQELHDERRATELYMIAVDRDHVAAWIEYGRSRDYGLLEELFAAEDLHRAGLR